MKKVIFEESPRKISLEDCNEDFVYIAIMGKAFYILKNEPTTDQYRWFSFDDTRTYYGESKNSLQNALSFMMHKDGAKVFQFTSILDLAKFVTDFFAEKEEK